MNQKKICVLFVLTLFSAFLLEEVEADKLKKLLAAGLIAKALTPKKLIIPLPLPIPIKIHKEKKKIFVPYPVHEYHTKFITIHEGDHGWNDWDSGWHSGGW